jgi:hypothetical protein
MSKERRTYRRRRASRRQKGGIGKVLGGIIARAVYPKQVIQDLSHAPSPVIDQAYWEAMAEHEKRKFAEERKKEIPL